MDVPSPFLRLRTDAAELKATTPDDARLWVREFDDPDGGDAPFWVDALRHDLTARGYRPLGEADEIRDGAGRSGRVAEFTTEVDGTEHGYLVAVFAVGTGRLRVAEFVAPRARYDELVATVRAALRTLGP